MVFSETKHDIMSIKWGFNLQDVNSPCNSVRTWARTIKYHLPRIGHVIPPANLGRDGSQPLTASAGQCHGNLLLLQCRYVTSLRFRWTNTGPGHWWSCTEADIEDDARLSGNLRWLDDEISMLNEAERVGFHAASVTVWWSVKTVLSCSLSEKKMVGSCWACRALASTWKECICSCICCSMKI